MDLGAEPEDGLHRQLDAARRSLDALQGHGQPQQRAMPLRDCSGSTVTPGQADSQGSRSSGAVATSR